MRLSSQAFQRRRAWRAGCQAEGSEDDGGGFCITDPTADVSFPVVAFLFPSPSPSAQLSSTSKKRDGERATRLVWQISVVCFSDKERQWRH